MSDAEGGGDMLDFASSIPKPTVHGWSHYHVTGCRDPNASRPLNNERKMNRRRLSLRSSKNDVVSPESLSCPDRVPGWQPLIKNPARFKAAKDHKKSNEIMLMGDTEPPTTTRLQVRPRSKPKPKPKLPPKREVGQASKTKKQSAFMVDKQRVVAWLTESGPCIGLGKQTARARMARALGLSQTRLSLILKLLETDGLIHREYNGKSYLEFRLTSQQSLLEPNDNTVLKRLAGLVA